MAPHLPPGALSSEEARQVSSEDSDGGVCVGKGAQEGQWCVCAGETPKELVRIGDRQEDPVESFPSQGSQLETFTNTTPWSSPPPDSKVTGGPLSSFHPAHPPWT